MAKTNIIVSIIFLILSAIIAHANAAKFTSGTIPYEGEKIRFVKMEGEIYERDNVKLKRIIKKYEDGNTPVEVIILNSIGGDVDESNDMVDTVIDNDLITMVLPKEQCMSACFSVYAAGGDRILYPASIVGVHRATIDGEGDNFEAKVTSLEMAELYDELDVPKSISMKMLKTPPNKMYYLNQKEMRAMSTEKSQFEESNPPKNSADLDAWLHEGSSAPVTAVGNY